MARGDITASSLQHHLPDQWPRKCQYFNIHCMNANNAVRQISNDATYSKLAPTGIDATFAGLHGFERLHVLGLSELASATSAAPARSSVFFIPYVRSYDTFTRTSKCNMNIDQDFWIGFLIAMAIPPLAVELLHENNGGSCSHISYCHDNPDMPCKIPWLDNKPCAQHFSFSVSQWGFCYARFDFHTNTHMILAMAPAGRSPLSSIEKQYQGAQQTHIYSILLTILEHWLQILEQQRWEHDFNVLRAEKDTGYGGVFHTPQSRALQPEKLALRVDISRIQGDLRDLLISSKGLSLAFTALTDSLTTFSSLRTHTQAQAQAQAQPTQLPTHLPAQLHSTLSLRQSQLSSQQSQISTLIYRIDAQWSFIAALISHQNNALNIDIATDTRSDSIAMRRISAITMIFLPPTFMATFFSMGFFQVGDDGNGNGQGSGLRVNSWIWIYFVCTVGLAVGMVGYVWMVQRGLLPSGVNGFLSRRQGKGGKHVGDDEKEA